VLVLKKSDFEAIASLPSLKRLEIRFVLDENAVSPLTRCKKLMHLSLVVDFSLLRPVLAVIGRELSGLSLRLMNGESVDVIIEYCPSLECLQFFKPNPDEEIQIHFEQSLKNSLKKLAYFEFGGESARRVRLGTSQQAGRGTLNVECLQYFFLNTC
jgi:hypothetical protein